MQTLFRKISRYLLLVMLATVISPSFGWEAMPAMAAQEHAAMFVMEEHHAGHDMSAMHNSLDDQADVDCCADLLHQCCPGHQLGQPQGNAISLLLPASPAAIDMVLSERFFTRVPEGLERPPRSISA